MRSLLFVAAVGLLAPYWLVDLSRFVVPALALALLLSYWRSLRWLLLLVVAFSYSSLQVQHQLQQQLRDCPDKLRVQASLRILEIQSPTAEITRFTALVQSVIKTSGEHHPQGAGCQLAPQQRLRLSWKDAPQLMAGATLRTELVLTEPWGYQNPQGFDYERWMLGTRLAATGYVRNGSIASKAPPSGYWLGIRLGFAQVLADYPHSALLQALVLGDVGQLDSADWQRLRLGGVVHLLVVSGLHIGLVASGMFLVVQLILRLNPWLLARVPARRVAVVVALLGSAGFLWLTGAKVPGVRAWFMLCAALLWLGQGLRLDPWIGYLWAGLLVLLIIPSSGWQQGFYLSFGAVGALLLYFQPRLSLTAGPPTPSITTSRFLAGTNLVRWLASQAAVLLQIQLALLIAMAPLSLLLGLPTPTLGFAINLAAVPWVSLVVVPLALLGTLSSLLSETFSHWLLSAASSSLGVFDQLLELAQWGSLWQPPLLGWPQGWLFGLLCALVLTPLGWRLRLLLLVGGFALLLNRPDPIPLGHFRILVFDVGQGSSILVSTKNHHLLFDSGPAYPSGFSAAQALVVPSLGGLHVRALDSFVLSHEDNDHAGGAREIRKLLQPRQTLHGGIAWPEQDTPGALPCSAGQGWIWSKVQFEILSPVQDQTANTNSNDRSCVLRVTSILDTKGLAQRALMFGDISQPVEMQLLHKLQPNAALMLAPHHGSATSSSRALVRRLQPNLVVASAARHSRYGHPHPQVVARYCEVGARLFVTGEVGAVTWRSDAPLHVHLARMAAKPWRRARLSEQLDRCR